LYLQPYGFVPKFFFFVKIGYLTNIR